MTEIDTMPVKSGIADTRASGTVIDVTSADQAKIAQDAGACTSCSSR